MGAKTEIAAEAVRPFYCGTQFADWQDRNCAHCRKYSFALDPATGKTREPLDEAQVCQIELALYRSGYGDGTVTPEIAQRMGYADYGKHHCWPCGEVDSITPEHAEAVTKFRMRDRERLP